MQPEAIVLVSGAMDLVWRVPAFPVVGESRVGTFARYPGGKGANQAVQAARLGLRVLAVGCLGADEFGDVIEEEMRRAGVDTRGVMRTKEASTATAGIYVEDGGRNTIAIDLGANRCLDADWVMHCTDGFEGWVLSNLEVPLAATLAATGGGRRLILNPAPGERLEDGVLERVSVLTPNETEAEILLGEAVDAGTAERLRGRGAERVVVTLGAEGAAWATPEGEGRCAAPRVEAVDTVGAGDSFNGALLVGLVEGMAWEDAVALAVGVASVSVTRAGAIPSLPTRAEL